MTLDDAKQLWSSDNEPAPHTMPASTLSDSELLRLVKEKSESFDRRIWWRDLLESLAAVVVILLFGWTLLSASSWLVQAGALIVMAGSGYVFWRLRRARTRHDDPSLDRPVAEVLRDELAKTEEQIHLLETIARWYLAPIVVGVLLIILGDDGWSWATLLQTAVVLLVSAGIYALNQRAVRCTFAPRREELTRLLGQVEDGSRP